MSGSPPQTISPLTNALTVGSSNQQQAYRPIMLSKKFVFGARAETKGGVHYLDEFTIIWAAGKNVVVYNTAQTQHFIPTSDGCEAISCIAASNVVGGKRFVAVAEAGDKPLINIYTFDPNKLPKFVLKKTLEVPDLGSREYVSMCFSADGRYLVSLGGFPEWTLVLWSVEKARHLATVSVVEKTYPSQDQRLLNQCSLSPKDPSLLCVSGNGILRFYRFADGQLRQSAGGIKGDPMNYLSHLWLPPEDRMIVSTDNGDLLYLENCEFKFPLPLSPSDGLSIDTLVAHSKGFVCGGDMGLVTIFERSDDKELYRKMRTLKIEADKKDVDGYALGEESSKVIAFSLTPPPGEENLALLTSNKQVLTLNLSNADFSRPGDQVCDHVCQPFHSGPITGLDICIRKPLIATCGKDRNIILWNYRTNAVECSKHFPSEILSIAIHPSGLHLIVGFPDKLRFMNIYGDDIREFRSYGIRSCTECRFSNGGQFFAAVTSTIIHVYGTYTCEVIGHLRGHNGKIKNIFFVPPDDTRILSVGNDGAVLDFSLIDFGKVNDNVIKAITYNAVTGDATSVWAAGNDRKLRFFDRAHLQQQADYDTRNATIMCLAQCNTLRLLLAGCEDGTLRVFNAYYAEKSANERKQIDKGDMDGKLAPKQDIMIESHNGHYGAITRICASFDEELVVTAGEDGVVTLWEVTAPHKGQRKEIKYTEEILIEKRDLEERTRNIAELQARVQELQQRKAHQSTKRRRKHEELMRKLEEEHREEKGRQDAQFYKLESEIVEQKLKFGEALKELDQKHVQDTHRIEQEYNAKIQALQEQSHKLSLAITEQQNSYAEQLANREQHWKAVLEQERKSQEEQLAKVSESIVKVMAEESAAKEEAEMIQRLIEEETETEIIALKEDFEKHRVQENTFRTKLIGENATLKLEEGSKSQALGEVKVDILNKIKERAILESKVESQNRDIDALNNELKERSETISDKDKRIYELKKKNQELEKFKFVLEYKIKELRSQIDPREEEIRQAQAKYKDMQEESDRYLRSNEALVLQIRTLKLKANGHAKEIESLLNNAQEGIAFQSRLWTELSDVTEERDNKRLKDMVKVLYYRYAQDGKGGGANASATGVANAAKAMSTRTTEDAQREYNRGRDYLERTLTGLKHKLVKDAETSRADKSRIINDNVTLIKEVNDLRREVRTLNAAKKSQQLGSADGSGSARANAEAESLQRELQIQRAEMLRLRNKVEELERQYHAAGRAVSQVTPPPF